MARRAAIALMGGLLLAGAGAGAAEAKLPNDPGFPKQYGLHNTGQGVNNITGIADADIDAPEAWDVTTGSSSVIVADVDDGINMGQTDIVPNVVAGYDFGNNDDNPAELDSTHGSQTAALIASRGNNSNGLAGVNWFVSLMPLKVLRDGPGGRFDNITTTAVAAAFRYAGDRGARVANASFGNPYSDEVLNALKSSSNTLFVVSAGNSARDVDANPRWPCSYNVPNLLCIGSSDQNDKLASFSNYGAKSVDMVAPGANIRTIMGTNTYAYYNGTSYSAPLVTGVAALYFAKYPDATVADVKNALMSGVDVKPAFVGKTVSGGRLNAARTLAIPPGSATPSDTTPPPAPSISPASGTYGAPQQVTMSDSEAGVTIRYTVGSGSTVPADPTSSTGTAYTGPIAVETDQVIKAAAFDAAGNRSAVTQRSYTITTTPTDTTPPPAPDVSPASGTYGSAQQVTMADAESGATIRYTVGLGSTAPADPTATTGTPYTGPVQVGESQVVKVAAFDAAGNRSAITRRDYTISAPVPATRTVTLYADADTMAKQASPTANYGSATSLLSDSQELTTTGSASDVYLRFNIPTLAAGERITAASLRVSVTNSSTNGPAVWQTGAGWTESGLTWNTAPSRTSSAAIGNFGASPSSGWYSTSLSGVTSSGPVSFQLLPESTDGLGFSAREADGLGTTTDPRLVLTISSS